MTYETLSVVSNSALPFPARKVARCMREHDDSMTYEILSVFFEQCAPFFRHGRWRGACESMTTA